MKPPTMRNVFWACFIAAAGYFAGLMQGAEINQRCLLSMLPEAIEYSDAEYIAVTSYLDGSPFPGAKEMASIAKAAHRAGEHRGATLAFAQYVEKERGK